MVQTQMAAEQTVTNQLWPAGPAPGREIQMTIRLQVPEDDGADVGIRSEFEPPFPNRWDDRLQQRLFKGVHAGLAAVDVPIPAGGIGVRITHLALVPPIDPAADEEGMQRLGDILETLTAATVTSLWAGLSHFAAQPSPGNGRAA